MYSNRTLPLNQKMFDIAHRVNIFFGIRTVAQTPFNAGVYSFTAIPSYLFDIEHKREEIGVYARGERAKQNAAPDQP